MTGDQGGAGAPSTTGQAVAVTRAGLSRPRSADGDGDSQERLCAGMRISPLDEMRPALAARTRFFDRQVMKMISAGIGQIVVVGAGYDDRALRFRTRGVTYYEVDHPSTQYDKVRRLLASQARTERLVHVAADFRRDAVSSALASVGHDALSASLFMCEGLLVYLDQATIVTLLGSLRACAAPGSTLAASLAIHHDDVASGDKVLAAANARRKTGRTEPWRTILPAEAHLELLGRSRWQVDSVEDAAELEEGVAEGRSLLVTARPG
jgi:methyltransferase (TIGR00027 family)